MTTDLCLWSEMSSSQNNSCLFPDPAERGKPGTSRPAGAQLHAAPVLTPAPPPISVPAPPAAPHPALSKPGFAAALRDLARTVSECATTASLGGHVSHAPHVSSAAAAAVFRPVVSPHPHLGLRLPGLAAPLAVPQVPALLPSYRPGILPPQHAPVSSVGVAGLLHPFG